MAFVVEQEKKNFPWITVLIGVFAIGIAGAVVYYFFFAETPLIESFSSKSYLEISATELETVQKKANQETLVNHPNFKNLKQQVSPMVVGTLGKANPFQPF
jgi:beta-lactamase regulating signal transducer with metallopeptidase domain